MKIFLSIVAVVLVVALIIGLLFSVGLLNIKFYEFFGTKKASADRMIFKENKSYVEGMASDLAKYRYELQNETDETAKEAIKDLVRSKYADFDIEKLEDYSLQQFLRETRGGY